MKGLQLNTEEKQLLVESLLFTASCDVCSDHTATHRKRILDLAEKINDKNVKLHNIFIYKTGISDDVTPDEIATKFPNVPRETIIQD
jgi:hypothetical protein